MGLTRWFVGSLSLLAVTACGEQGGPSPSGSMGDTPGEVNGPEAPTAPAERPDDMAPTPGGEPAATPDPVDGEPSAMNPDATPESPSPDDVVDPDDPEAVDDPDEPAAVDDTDHNEFTRLTREEYRATVLSALGVDVDANTLPVDGRVGGFTSNVLVTPDPVHPYLLAAEDIAARVVPGELPACEAEDVVDCVATNYAGAFATLFRRPVSAFEMDNWAAMVGDLEEQGLSPTEATQSLVTSVLLSPDFLFRASASNLDAAGARRYAERLSFALWDAPPDEALAAAAEDAATLGEQALRLSREPQAVRVLARFVGQWLRVDTDDLHDDDANFGDDPNYLELLAFVEDALANDLAVRDFIAGPTGWVHEDNAETYGLGASDETLSAVSWAQDSYRRGVLGQELFAGATRHPDASRRPIFRGLLVRRSLLCTEIPAPDPALIELAGEVGDRTEDARCSTCHQLLDPIGRAFAPLDPDGEGVAVPAEVIGAGALSGTYDDVAMLLEAVATSREFADCFAEHWLSFFLERPRGELDPGWVAEIADAVETGESLSSVAALSIAGLQTRSMELVPWCTGE